MLSRLLFYFFNKELMSEDFDQTIQHICRFLHTEIRPVNRFRVCEISFVASHRSFNKIVLSLGFSGVFMISILLWRFSTDLVQCMRKSLKTSFHFLAGFKVKPFIFNFGPLRLSFYVRNTSTTEVGGLSLANFVSKVSSKFLPRQQPLPLLKSLCSFPLANSIAPVTMSLAALCPVP